MFDIVIRGGDIIDGTKAKRFRGDVGIQEGRIVQVGDLGAAEAHQTIDATGRQRLRPCCPPKPLVNGGGLRFLGQASPLRAT